MLNGKILKTLPTRDLLLPILCTLAQAIIIKVPISDLFATLLRYYTDAGILDNFPPELSKKILAQYSPKAESYILQVDFANGKITMEDNTEQNRELTSSNQEKQVLLNIKSELETFFTLKQGFPGISHINFQDGIRIWFTNGDIVHLRPSGNAPQFRVYYNATTQERAGEIVGFFLSELDGIIFRIKKMAVEPRGFEPLTSSVQGRRSPN